MKKSLLLAVNDLEENRTREMFELDDALVDLVCGGAVVKCASKEYILSTKVNPDGSCTTVIDCA